MNPLQIIRDIRTLRRLAREVDDLIANQRCPTCGARRWLCRLYDICPR